MSKDVSSLVDKHAEAYGNKSANLMVMREGVEGIDVPDICPLSHEICIAHLNKHNEDWQDIWNESYAGIAATIKDLSIACGNVIASYFSEKSLEQRLKAKRLALQKRIDNKSIFNDKFSRIQNMDHLF